MEFGYVVQDNPALLLCAECLHVLDVGSRVEVWPEDYQTDSSGCPRNMLQETAGAQVRRVGLVVLWDVVSLGQDLEIDRDTRSSVR
jgi:hypothetical protein